MGAQNLGGGLSPLIDSAYGTRDMGGGYDRKFESTSNRCCRVANDFTNSQYIPHDVSAGLASPYTHAAAMTAALFSFLVC